MAVNFDAMNQVYNHYLAEYAPRTNTPLDTHKKSDLRNIYNSIVKLNKEAPLYILDSSAEAKSYAVGLKESARAFQGAVASTSSSIENDDVLNKKIAYSTNPSIADVKYIGEGDVPNGASAFEISVDRLASPQVNMGNVLPKNQKIGLEPGAYSFDLSINDMNFEFQFQLKEADTNDEVMQRLSRLITNADVGIEAETIYDDDGGASLKLSSATTGQIGDKDVLFSISDENTSKSSGIVDYLGMNQVSRYASDAIFEINGIERRAGSNTFSVEKIYEVTLKGLSPDPLTTTQIGLKDDFDSLSENIASLTKSYNEFLKNASTYPGAHAKSSQLLGELGYITRHYAPSLETLGITFAKDGKLEIDEDKLQESISSGEASQGLNSVKDFASSMLRKTNQIALNPMEYVNKTVVAYKNPGKSYPAPYITSAYSGMMFNNYC